MSHYNHVKNIIGNLNPREIRNLLNYLRQKTEFIIPRCYSKFEIVKLLESEGIRDLLTDEDYHRIKNEFDNGCAEIMNEILRTRILMALDASSEVPRLSK
jgi:hypothetical protein